MKRFFSFLIHILSAALSSALLFTPAHAGIFDDEEARKAILDLRAKVSVLSEQLVTKADKAVILGQLNQSNSLQEEIAKLRGQIEVLSNEVSDSQRRQKDFYIDLDSRLRKLEPQKILVDGKEAQVSQSEQKSYDTAIVLFQSGDYVGAANALSIFIRTYPRSIHVPNAQYSLGIANYANKDYKNAVAVFQSLIKDHPESAKAPDAMLNIASCYSEQKQNWAAKKILLRLRAEYPDSTAAKTAIDRLNLLK